MPKKPRKAPKGRKPKKVSYELIPRQSDTGGRRMYALLDELVEAHHEELIGAQIVLAWNLTWKPDVDGRVTLGKCKKASDLDRELTPFDFVILLRREFWTHPTVTDQQRRALLDHELCHATVAYDDDGEPKVDERDRTVYRVRKHDLEEFSAIAERYGCWKRDLEQFAAALALGRAGQPALGFEPPANEGDAAELPARANRAHA
jgi:hypothetical protein